MRGFKAGSKPKAPRSIKSGTIQGPGTGTSDDVKATVAEGSYVMPADSTAQIGAEQLQGMGAPVDVNLSNGEQLMSPEQVHAVGVQTLDAMKNATHVPAAQQQGVKGFQPRGNEQGKPELFFADGGAVQEFSDSVGGYWSSDNAQFEAGSPSTMQRVGRAINPVTSLGSAIGAMHDAAGQGDVAGMGLAAAQAIPVFGAVRAVAPTLKTAAGFVPSAGKTAAATAGSAAFGAAADQYTPSEQSYADGGPVYSRIDPDELGRNNTPQRKVTPRPAPIYVDGQGTATRVLPSQSRALVPAGPVTGTEVATTRQPSPAGAAPGGASQADFHTNSRGETGRGFSPSSSRAVVPAGPVTGTSLVPVNQPTAGSPDTEAPKASARPEPDYRARAEVKARAARDTAAFEADRAAQDARFEAAKNQPAAPEKAPGRGRAAVNGAAGKGVGALAIVPALAESAADDSTARYAQRFGMDEPTGDGSAGDILKFAALRGLGFASDLGNSLTMGLAGNLYRDNQGEQAPGAAVSAPSQQAASAAPGQAQSQQAAPSAPAPAAPAAPQGNGYQQTGINGIVGKKDENGQYSFTNEGAAVAGASGQLDMPNRGGTFSVASGGQEGMERNLRAAEIMQSAREAGARGFRQGGVTVVRDSSRDGEAGRAAIAAASTPYRGSPGGQLTANQLRTLAGLQESSDRNATDLARERIQQEGADGRVAITEAGANQRFAQSNALDQQRTAAELESKGFAARSAQRLEKLYEQYDKAAPEDRAAIAEQLRVLTGKDKPDQYGTVSLGTEVDPITGMVTNRGDAVFNRANGQIIGQSAALPPIEQNPQALAIKNNQNLSRDERAKQLRALGYQ
jgi:hypothetical protein